MIGKIRNIITKSEIEKIITDTQKSDIEWIEDRKFRSASYRELLSNPHPSVLLPLIKAIFKKSLELSDAGKRLTSTDKEAFEASLRYVRDEFSFALGMASTEIDYYIENALGFFPSIT